MNKALIVLGSLIILSMSLANRTPAHLKSQPFHFLNGKLCQSQGGFICGLIDKECCSVGCDSKWIGLLESCVDDKVLKIDAQSCQSMCERYGGVSFHDSILTDSQCCRKDLLKDNVCLSGGNIPLTNCHVDTLADQIIGFIKPS